MHTPPQPPEFGSPDELPEPDLTPEGIPIPNFTPWRAKRERVGGWSPEVQRAFIAELTRIGSVGAAARSVGKTARSAYQLRDKDGAESFAVAWLAAMQVGQECAQQVAIERALHGELVPQFRAGRFTGYKMVHNDRLLIAALSSSRRYADGGDTAAQLSQWEMRLEKWEAALRREAIDLQDARAMPPAPKPQHQDDAWEDHRVWQREMKAEARRQRNAEIRAAVRKSMAKEAPPGPRVWTL